MLQCVGNGICGSDFAANDERVASRGAVQTERMVLIGRCGVVAKFPHECWWHIFQSGDI